MKNVFITCLLALPLLVSAAPPRLERRVVVVAPRPVTPNDSCVCSEFLYRVDSLNPNLTSYFQMDATTTMSTTAHSKSRRR
jgi:hypothetical protein